MIHIFTEHLNDHCSTFSHFDELLNPSVILVIAEGQFNKNILLIFPNLLVHAEYILGQVGS